MSKIVVLNFLGGFANNIAEHEAQLFAQLE